MDCFAHNDGGIARLLRASIMPAFLKIVALGALLAFSSKPVMAIDRDTDAPAVFDCWEPERIFKQCTATGSDGRPRLKRAYLARLRYDPDGLASVLLMGGTGTQKSQWFYVRRGVAPVPVETMDNGADYFNDGLARSQAGGKIGYIDRKLNLVIPATYDGAYPFKDGVAVVCTACTIAGDGEHSWYEGGQWGRIDRRGRVVTSFRPWEKYQQFEFK
jgi:hypothetical protein